MRFFAFLFFLSEAVFIYLFVDKFGFLNYFLEVLVSGFVGIALLFNAGFSSLNSPQVAFKSFLGGNLFSQLGLSFGGALLFLPGILTDIFGIAILRKMQRKMRAIRSLNFKTLASRAVKKMMARSSTLRSSKSQKE